MRARGLLLATLALALAARASAWDLRFLVSDSTSLVGGQGTTLTQVNRATALLILPLGDDMALRASGLYELRGSFASGAVIRPLRLDLGAAEIGGTISAVSQMGLVLRWSVGRLALEDFSGRLLSGLYDGERLEFGFGNVMITFAGAYTGLLFKDQALIFIDADDEVINADPGIDFAPKRALFTLGGRAAEILPGHDLGLEFWGQVDLEAAGTATQGVYVEPFVEGRFGSALRWRAWGLGQMSYDGSTGAALAFGGLVRYYLPELLALRLSGGFEWASGPFAGLGAFTPIRQGSLAPVSAFPFTNGSALTLEAAAAPLRGMSIAARTSVLFRSSDSLVGSSGIAADASGPWLGAEAGIDLGLRLASDLDLGMDCGIFVPNTLGYFEPGTAATWTVGLSASLSL